MLDNVVTNPTFIKHMITGDKVRVYEYDVETNQQSNQRRSKNEPKSKKTTSKTVKY